MADKLTQLYARYLELSDRFFAPAARSRSERTELYFTELLPTFKDIKREADAVLDLNQRNMEDRERAGPQGRGLVDPADGRWRCSARRWSPRWSSRCCSAGRSSSRSAR